MANQFEDSRIAGGTLNREAQKVGKSAHDAPAESKAISRDDARDGVETAPTDEKQHPKGKSSK